MSCLASLGDIFAAKPSKDKGKNSSLENTKLPIHLRREGERERERERESETEKEREREMQALGSTGRYRDK